MNGFEPALGKPIAVFNFDDLSPNVQHEDIDFIPIIAVDLCWSIGDNQSLFGPATTDGDAKLVSAGDFHRESGADPGLGAVREDDVLDSSRIRRDPCNQVATGGFFRLVLRYVLGISREKIDFGVREW